MLEMSTLKVLIQQHWTKLKEKNQIFTPKLKKR